MTLTEFLLARIAEDAEHARLKLTPHGSAPGSMVRVLAECEAKRRIVGLHAPITLRRITYPGGRLNEVQACGYDTYEDGAGWVDYPCWTLQILALPYASHPDYREEWRP